MPIINYQVLEPFYRIWQSNAVRLRMPTTVIFIAPYHNQQMQALPEVYQADFTQFLSEHVRQTDVIFEVPTMGWIGILLLGVKKMKRIVYWNAYQMNTKRVSVFPH